MPLTGERGIRTPGAINPAVFKTAAIDHSAISPQSLYHTSHLMGRDIPELAIFIAISTSLVLL